MKNYIEDYFKKLKTTIDKLDRKEIENFIRLLITARDNDSTIFIMGNGGSASTASHFLCDIAKGMDYKKGKKIKIICLSDNTPIMMAYANDVSYDDIFVEQLKTHLKKDDVVIGISGSGNSKNVLKAIEFANKNGGLTVGLTGYDGGKLKKIARHSINANVDDMQISEDTHLILTHLTMQVLDKV